MAGTSPSMTSCGWSASQIYSMTFVIISRNFPMDDSPAPKVEYGVTPTEVMASMAGIDFVRAIFDGKLPAPPIMQTIEPFDSTAEPGVVVMHSIPGFRHYNPIGSVHWRLHRDVVGFGDGACGAFRAAGGDRLHHAGIQGLLHQGHDRGYGARAHRRPHAQCRPPRRHRGGAHHRRQGPPLGARHHDLPGFRNTERPIRQSGRPALLA